MSIDWQLLEKLLQEMVSLDQVESEDETIKNNQLLQQIKETLRQMTPIPPKIVETLIQHNIPSEYFINDMSTEWTTWKNNHGRTLLHIALLEDAEPDTITGLLHSTLINTQDSSGETPLHLAIQSDDYQLLQKMIQEGGDLSIVRSKPSMDTSDFHPSALEAMQRKTFPEPLDTPLNLALVSCASNKIPLYLVTQCPDQVNVPMGREGQTPLHLAISRSDPDLVKALLTQNADLSIQRRDNGETALMQCLSAGEEVWTGMIRKLVLNEKLATCRDLILEVIKDSSTLNLQDWDGWTALHICAEQDDVSTCQRLLSLKADPNIKNRSGNTPLHVAGKELWSKTFALLVSNGADATLVNNDSKTPASFWPEEFEPMCK